MVKCEKPFTSADSASLRAAIQRHLKPASQFTDPAKAQQCAQLMSEFDRLYTAGRVFRGASDTREGRPPEPRHKLMHRLVIRGGLLLALLLCAMPGLLSAQDAAPRDALSAVAEAMFFRRSALGDTLPFDACSVYERGGRPADFPAGILPGLQGLLDRPVSDPCSVPRPSADSRYERLVRVTSVEMADSAARVHLNVRRGEWTYTEVYHLSPRANDGAWMLREVRMYPPVHTTPPPR